jgi:hypothetical protein
MDGRLRKKWKKTMGGLEEGWRSCAPYCLLHLQPQALPGRTRFDREAVVALIAAPCTLMHRRRTSMATLQPRPAHRTAMEDASYLGCPRARSLGGDGAAAAGEEVYRALGTEGSWCWCLCL